MKKNKRLCLFEMDQEFVSCFTSMIYHYDYSYDYNDKRS